MPDRKIIAQVPRWLTMYDDGFIDRTWTGPPEVTYTIEPVPAHDTFINSVAVHDVTIDANTGLRVRIYQSETAATATKRPILLHFHGGGFCITQPDWYLYYMSYTKLVKATGAICVSVYLRHAPEHRLPTAIDDGYSALLWLRRLSQQTPNGHPWLSSHGDFTGVFLIGESSGGSIVHQVAARAGSDDLSPLRLAGAIPLHPCFVRAERSKSEVEQPAIAVFSVEMLDVLLELALPEGSTKDHPIVCPMSEAMDGLNLPPYLMCVAEKDPMIDREMEFYEAMKKANKKIDLLVSYGMSHVFYLNQIGIDLDPQIRQATQEIMDRINKFIQEH